ncbi:MAG: PLP-dependent aminotransferase family protein [Terrisporobacter othiniensis]|uniref:PLP-dependent aminotransferase family protein n=1 Tax=Terrisporobacter hibernicus TaxID=2813371 RepID=A0AAX2ZKS3_9FIRM|nr:MULTISPECIES: PLP-dependent aminotransferase family protein [Terrisporobacter]MDU4862555.1 PLP-dependent aminotransferase family protein [Terrisporobacter othiniensis]UPA30449.1 PLP-dependent aminotransferase family protein [Terrisporobacter glycolicus]MDU6996490.1 PLP-dependent aminotransferase family protein [Terrisporobacter othiniensis]UEL49591.1 PLP-dependent aminotransferase family protein [Terrisporobacter hibernicus]SFJ68881.1 2-aminoadipate transaminase [Terrisporobacter glycolicus
MAVRFADRMSKIEGSAIRELLKLTARPEVISFAGGMPAPELFPVEEMKKVSVAVLEEQGRVALQYTSTEGYLPLREKIAARMNKTLKTNVGPDDILVTSGSQQGLDFSGKTFLDKGDVVLCESPSYMGALNAMKAYEPEFIEINTDNDGMIMEDLEKVLASNDKVKLIYVIPDFQNPSGRTWPLERRIKFMEIINKYEIPVVEDNPYGELRFDGESLPSLKSLDTKGLVIYLGTFSKIFCPGYRLGWTCAAPEILAKYNICKQGSDLQASTISQMEVSKFMDMYDLDEHVAKIKSCYVKRRDIMLKTMKEEFPECVEFTHPQGGLFTWVTFPEGINAGDMAKKCLEKNVAYVPGESFYPNGGVYNTCRLNYSNMPEEKIVEGIKRMGEVLREELAKNEEKELATNK